MRREEEKYTTLDTEQCKWWVNHLFNIAKEKACNSHNFDDAEEIQSAQNKIIKTLEQEPCEDCVSRKSVLDMCKKEIDHISKNWQNYHSPSEAKSGFEYIAKNIYDLPPVTPTHTETVTEFADRCVECGKQKKGKWIYHEKSVSTGFKDLRECSCCKCYFRWEMPRNSYCPNCGAEMESEE
jgi:hypothetical protein